MGAGAKKKKVFLQRKAPGQDTSGDETGGPWATYRTAGARIRSLNGREKQIAGQLVPEVTSMICINRFNGRVKPNDRVKYGERIFDILYVDEKDRPWEVWLTCKERVIV